MSLSNRIACRIASVCTLPVHHSDYSKPTLAAHEGTSDTADATDVSGMKLFVLFAVQVANCVRDVKHEPRHIQMHTAA
jgi:hypothetical protein